MESILPFVRKGLPEGLDLDICVDDENYQELALHGLVLQLGIWLATTFGAPVLVNLVSEYIKNRRRKAPDESTVRFRLLLQRSDREDVTAIEYEGPADEFREVVGSALDKCLAEQPLGDAPEILPAPDQDAKE
jgi:hypothetical protein